LNNKRGRLYNYEIALIVYAFLIPIEDIFLQDIIGSSSRIAGASMIILYIFSKRKILWSLSPDYLYLYFVWAALSVFIWANKPDYYSTFRLFMWMLTVIIGANIVRQNFAILPNLFKAYFFSSLILVVLALKNFISMSKSDISRVDILGMDQNLLASHFLVCIVCSLYIYFRTELTLNKRYYLVGFIILFLLGIISTGSRSALLTFVLIFILISPFSSLRFLNYLKIFIFFFFAYLFLRSDNSFTELLYERVLATENDKGGNRLIIWKVAGSVIENNPLMGVGYRNFRNEFSNYLGITGLDSEELLKLGDRSEAGTHNAILEVFSELGLIGLIFFYAFQYIIIKRLKKVDKNYSSLIIFLLIAINFNCMFLDISNLKYFWLVVALGISISSKLKVKDFDS
jgi:putative inorganic carbon (HCO3(-)) transporter